MIDDRIREMLRAGERQRVVNNMPTVQGRLHRLGLRAEQRRREREARRVAVDEDGREWGPADRPVE